jgi:hypothetical protein
VLLYCTALSNSRAFSIATETCAPNWLAHDHLVDLGELAERGAQEVQRADHASLAAERHDELRPGARHRIDVARVGLHVVDDQRPPFKDGGAHQPLPHLEPQLARHVLGIADRIGDLQFLGAGVEEVHGKRVESDQSRNELRNLVQQLLDVEHRRDFPPEIEQRANDLAQVRRCRRRRCGCG